MENALTNNVSLTYEHEYFSLKLDRSDSVTPTLPTGLSGMKQFTLMAWIYLSDLHTVKSCVSQQDGLDFGIENDMLYFEYAGSRFKSDSILIGNIWNHIAAVVYDNSVQLYLNGTEVVTQEYQDIKFTDKQFIIGRDFFGYIRNVMLYQKALITDEIVRKMYNFSLDEDVVLCCDFTCNPPIERKSGKTISLSGNVSIVKLMPAASFNDYSFFRCMEGRKDPWFTKNRPFTFQTWLYFTPDDQQDYYVIFSNVHSLQDIGFEIGLIRRNDAFRICVYFGDADRIAVETDSAISEDIWHNIALVYEESKLKLYIDCTLSATSSELESAPLEQAAMLIGARHSAFDDCGESWFHGFIARIDIWDTVLNDTELKTYAETIPEIPTDHLTASWCFFQDNVFNSVTDAPLSRVNDVRISLKEENAAANTSEAGIPKQLNESAPVLPQEIIDKARAESGILKLMAADNFDPKMSLISSCAYQNKIYFLHHDMEASYPITCISNDIDEVTQWCIELVLIILEGIVSYFLSLKITYNQNLAQFIRTHILSGTGIGNILAKASVCGTFTLSLLFSIMKELLFSGKFTQLLRMACSISFWTIVSFIVGFARRFLSGAAEIVIWAGILMVQLGIHWLKYPEKSPVEFQLESVLFCHDTADKICSIHIRKNNEKSWELPEWKRGREDGDNAPAVYRLARFTVNDNTLQIKAEFTVSNPTKQTKKYSVRADGGALFGMSDTVEITCPSGASRKSAFFSFPSAGELLTKHGIDKQELSLSWEYQDNSNQQSKNVPEFMRFQLSKHRIYTILDSVNAPWGRTERHFVDSSGKNVQISYPMTDVYDATIDIVHSLTTPDAAKAAITNYIYSCGRYVYNGYSSLYAPHIINKTAFLEAVLPPPAGQTHSVNCEDCTCILCAIANLYGCHLQYLYLGRDFPVQSMLLIGETTWRLPNGGIFEYHCLAVEAGNINNIPSAYICYDSCLKYHGNITLSAKLAIREQLYASNPPAPNKDTYVESICTPNGIQQCHAGQPGDLAFLYGT